MSDALSFELAGIAPDGMAMQPDRRIIQFRTGRRHLSLRSQQEGRPIYAPVDLFCVQHPGERDQTVVEATEFHKQTHPRQWEAYQNGRKADIEGTPLSVLFPADEFVVEHLRGLHIYTVEMLAGITEAGLQRIGMGGREYKSRAEKYMEAATSSAPLREMEAKLAERDSQLATMQAQIDLLIANARKATDDEPRRRRRSPTDEGEGE